MTMRIGSWLRRPALLRTLVSHLRLAGRLLRDPGVPLLVKAVPLAAAAYVLVPFDLVPDLVPALGQIDDLGVAMLALEAFVRLCPERLVEFHRSATSGGRPYSPAPSEAHVIDAEFRHE